MAKERKKVKPKPIPIVEPKKREEKVKGKKKVEKVIEKEEVAESKVKAKASDDKYIRISIGASVEDYKKINDRVLREEIKWAYYGIDNDKGYQYYIVLKK